MKPGFLFILAASIFFSYVSTTVAAPAQSNAGSNDSAKLVDKRIQSIQYTQGADGQETLIFRANAPLQTKIFTISGDKPRLVIDLPGCDYDGKSQFQPQGSRLSHSIRVGVHGTPSKKVRVVVDLKTNQQIFYTTTTDSADQLQVHFSAKNKGRAKAYATEKKEAAPANIKKQSVQTETTPVEKTAQKKQEPPEAEQSSPPKASLSEKPEAAISAEKPTILEIAFDGSSPQGEVVLFHLNGFHPPAVSALEQKQPKVVCDFHKIVLGKKVQENIQADGKYVRKIQTLRNQENGFVTVELELSPDRNYDLQQLYFKDKALFMLIVNELEDKQTAKEKG